MKKMLVFFPMLLLLFSNSFSQDSEVKKQPEGFKFWNELPEYVYGNVKEIHSKTFDAVEINGEIVKAGMVIVNSFLHQPTSYYFNKEGQIVQWTAKNLAGEWVGTLNYKNDKLIEINWLGDNVYKFRWDYSYQDGKVQRISTDIPNSKVSGIDNFELDKNGFVIKRTNPSNKENFDVYERKNDGTIIDKKTIAPDGKIIAHFDKWEYNDKNNLLRVHRAILGGEKVDIYGVTRTFECDDKGNWIKQTTVHPRNHNIRVIERDFVYFE